MCGAATISTTSSVRCSVLSSEDYALYTGTGGMASMSGTPESSPSMPDPWAEAADDAFRHPLTVLTCPQCGRDGLRATWNVVDLKSREANVDLACGICGATRNLRLPLPAGVPNVFPLERITTVDPVVELQLRETAERARRLASQSPVARFTTSPLWIEAAWSSTTFRWHPTSAAPPVMGIVFSNAEKGRQLFRGLIEEFGNADEAEEIRVSIIEGDVPGQRPGYSVHIGPDPDALRALGTFEDIIVDHTTLLMLGQLNRMYPIPGRPNLLQRFKLEFPKHKEFLLAPVTRRADGQLWVDVELGIIKKSIHFRDLADINEGDVDAAALALPLLITPRPE